MEVIISFVIFLGFLIFLMAIFRPFKAPINEGIVDSVFANLDKKFITEIRTISISLNVEDELTPCIKIDSETLAKEDDGLNCEEAGVDGKNHMIVRDKDGNILQSKFDIDNSRYNFLINTKFNEGSEGKYFTIYCGDYLEQNPNNILIEPSHLCNELKIQGSQIDYKLGLLSNKRLWSNHSLIVYEAKYKTDYAGFKEGIVSTSTDFGMIVYDLDNNVLFNMTQKMPRGVEISAKTLPVEIVNRDASFHLAKANIVVW